MNAPPDQHSSLSPPVAVGLAEATRFWLKLGFIGFGGPAGQIALMHRELVERRRWISERRFLHALNYCMLLPGPEAQQLATYIGWLMHRTWGGIVAGALFVLPSLFLLIALSWLYIAFGDLAWVAGLFYGIKPAVIAIVVQATLKLGQRVLQSAVLAVIAVGAFLAILVFGAPFPAIIAGAALFGYIGSRYLPDKFAGAKKPAGASKSYGPALIGDHSAPADHARFRWTVSLRVVAIGVALWALPMGLLTLAYGWQGTLTQMAWFFSKAALLTIGGAYAVLPYVYQGAVVDYGWLSAEQMIDGLALGETTPGPLIMVVAFVGFVGAYLQPNFGIEQPLLAGAVAATLVTWFTFLPSFVLILAGGPLVESSHRELRSAAPLTAISAAIVGVILHLALFFAFHVLWPQGWQGPFDWLSAAITAAAAVALIRYQRASTEVIFACAAMGLLLSLFELREFV